MTRFGDQANGTKKMPGAQVETKMSPTSKEAIKEARRGRIDDPLEAKVLLCELKSRQANEKPTNESSFSTSRLVGSLRRQLVAAFSSDRSPIKMRRSKLWSMQASLQQPAQDPTRTEQPEMATRPLLQATNDGDDNDDSRTSPVPDLIKLKRLSFKRKSKLPVTPRHLIRMFAERRNDSSEQLKQEPPGRNQGEASVLEFLVDTPTRAVNCLRYKQEQAKLDAAREYRVATQSSHLFNYPRQPVSDGQSKEQQLSRLICILNSASNDNESQQNCDTSFQLEYSWTKVFRLSREDNEQQRANISLQQDAIWELITTELSYIKRLKLIVELFQSTLVRLQQQYNLLTEIDGHLLLSNINQVLEANLNLYVNYLRPTVEAARSSCTPLDFAHFMQPFIDISNLFRPYYRYCIEQADCIGYIRRQRESNECFKSYLAWCESQKECERLRLTDLLAHPMQRLTRYPLLLKTIAKRSQPNSSPSQQQMLAQMIAHVDRFVSTVDLELRRQDEFNRLLNISNRLQLIDSVGLEQHNNEIQTILRSYNNQFDLMVSLFECQYLCSRQLIYDSSLYCSPGSNVPGNDFANLSLEDHQHLGQLKFKDASTSSKLDVILLIFTDQLFVCRQSSTLSPSKQPPCQANQSFKSSMYSLRSNESHPPVGAIDKLNNLQVHSLSSEGQQAAYTTSSTATTIRPRRRAVSHSHAIPVLSSDTIDDSPGLLASRRHLQKYSTGDIVASCRVVSGLVSPSKLFTRVQVAKGSSNCSLPVDRRMSSSFTHHNHRPVGLNTRNSSSQSMMRMTGPGNDSSEGYKTHNHHHRQPTARNRLHLGHTKRQQHVSLRSIRSPYPIERLVMHELDDGLSVLFCQLNDSNTIANSFVLHCPKRSVLKTTTGDQQRQEANLNLSSSFETMSLINRRAAKKSSCMQTRSCSDAEQPAKVTKSQSPASRIIDLVKQAQVRYRMAAQFHGVELVAPNELNVIQPLNKLKLVNANTQEASPMADNNKTSEARQMLANNTTMHKTVDLSRHLKFAIEQHKLSLLSHGKHDLLARNDFDYTLVTKGNKQHFEIKSTPISSSLATQANQDRGPMSHLSPANRKKDSLMVPSGMTTTLSDDDDLPSTSMNSFSSQGNLSSSCGGGDDLTKSSILSINTSRDFMSLNVSPRQTRTRPQFSRSARVYRTANQSIQQREFASKNNSNCSSIPRVSVERLAQPDFERSPPTAATNHRSSLRSHLQTSSFGSGNYDWDLSDTSEGNCLNDEDDQSRPGQDLNYTHKTTGISKRHILSSMRRQNVVALNDQQLAHSAPGKLRPIGQEFGPQRNSEHESWLGQMMAGRRRQPTTLSEESTFYQSMSQASAALPPSSATTSRDFSTHRDTQITGLDRNVDDSFAGYSGEPEESPLAESHLAPRDKKEPRATSFELGNLRQKSLLSSKDTQHVLTTNFRSSSAEVHSQVSVTLTSPQSNNMEQETSWNGQSNENDSEQSESSLERKYKEECIFLSIPESDGLEATSKTDIDEPPE